MLYTWYVIKDDRGRYLTELGTWTTSVRLANPIPTLGLAMEMTQDYVHEKIFLMTLNELEMA